MYNLFFLLNFRFLFPLSFVLVTTIKKLRLLSTSLHTNTFLGALAQILFAFNLTLYT